MSNRQSDRPAGLFDGVGAGSVGPASLSGRRDGATFDAAADLPRLNRQAWAVWLVVRDSAWRSLAEIALASQELDASVSARLRDFRKDRFGAHVVERRRRSGGVHEYRVLPRSEVARVRNKEFGNG